MARWPGRIDRADAGGVALKPNRRLSNAQTLELRQRRGDARAGVLDDRRGHGREPLPDQLDQTDQAVDLKKLKGNTGIPKKRRERRAKGATGAQGAQGAQGGAGAQGPAGTAVAFAHLQGDSTPGTPLDTSGSKNVSAASVGEPGLYCVTTSVPITNATGNTDLVTSTEGPDTVSFNFSEVPLAIALKLCPIGTTVLVETITSTDKPVTLDAFVSFN